jgi:hypothetical protein
VLGSEKCCERLEGVNAKFGKPSNALLLVFVLLLVLFAVSVGEL